MAKFVVAITHGEGVVLSEQYEKLDGSFFEDLVKSEYGNMFAKTNKGDSNLWVHDGDPS